MRLVHRFVLLHKLIFLLTTNGDQAFTSFSVLRFGIIPVRLAAYFYRLRLAGTQFVLTLLILGVPPVLSC